MTLTTVDPDTAAYVFRHGVAVVAQRLRRAGYPFQYFLKVEFTTGTARLSGGYRRIHGHLLCKGLDGCALALVTALVRESWSTVTGASVVEVAELRSLAGQLHYLGLHHGKVGQAPPASWRGMVERASAGYWTRPIRELREQAKLELAGETLAWSSGLDIGDASFLVALQADDRRRRRDEMAVLRAELRELQTSGFVGRKEERDERLC